MSRDFEQVEKQQGAEQSTVENGLASEAANVFCGQDRSWSAKGWGTNERAMDDSLPSVMIAAGEHAEQGRKILAGSMQESNAVESGEIKDIQKVLAGVKSPEDYENLKKVVETLNDGAPSGVTYKLTMDKNQNPQLEIDSKGFNPNFGGRGSTADEITITADSAKAVHRTGFGIVPQNDVDPDRALDRVQKKYS